MAKTKKIIVKSGFHYVNDGKGGRKLEVITPQRLQRIADTHQKMVESGIKIPAPERHFFKHPTTGKFAPFDPININTDENNPAGSKSNFGWWEKMEVVPTTDENGEPCTGLQGTLDAPLEEDAEKIGKTVKDTSIFLTDKWTDGKGKTWEGDVMTHTALVTKPIEKSQENFTTAEGYAIAMSQHVPVSITEQEYTAMENMEDMDNINDAVSEPDVVTLKELLKKVVKIHLPEDTTSSNIGERLELALRQKELDEQGKDGTLTKPPKGAVSREVPVVMSEEIKLEDISEDLVMSHPVVKELKASNDTMMNALSKIKQDQLKTRLNALDLPEDKMEEMKGRIAKVVMSFDATEKDPVEDMIEFLESSGAKKKVDNSQPDPNKGVRLVAMSNEELTEALANVGLVAANNDMAVKSEEDQTAIADSLIDTYN